jgi:hypothetical protein
LLSSFALAGCSDDEEDGSGGAGGSTGGTAGSGATGGSAGSGATGGSAGSGATGGSAGSTGGSAGSAGDGGLQTGQVDRKGRPGIATALIGSANKNAYNQSPKAQWSTYATEIEASLASVDGLDGDNTNGLLAASRSVLAGIIADDQLKVDIAIDDCTDGYLAIELGSTTNCGGRTLQEDVMDKTLQSLVDASGTTTVTDAVDANDKVVSDAFPYLAEPH